MKPVRGGSLPLKIIDKATYDEVRSAATVKRKAYDKRFYAERGYVIAYPDTSIALKIPGTDDDFVLRNYKEWLGKAYFRLTLYLSPVYSIGENEDESDLDGVCDMTTMSENTEVIDQAGNNEYTDTEHRLHFSSFVATDFM